MKIERYSDYRRNQRKRKVVSIVLCICVMVVVLTGAIKVGQNFLNGNEAVEAIVHDGMEFIHQFTGSDGETITVNRDSWELILVNNDNILDESYTFEKVPLKSGHYVGKRIEESLLDMLEDAKQEGLMPIVCSAYRSVERQRELFDQDVAYYIEIGYSEAEAINKTMNSLAFPGTSEHNTGLAVDIVSSDYQILDEQQEETPEFIWLSENCHKYGFILRYPKGKSDITGIIYEPWHFRYVGVEAAAYIMGNGITLEEYLTQ